MKYILFGEVHEISRQILWWFKKESETCFGSFILATDCEGPLCIFGF